MLDLRDYLNEGKLLSLFQPAGLAVRYKEGLISPKEKEALNRWLAESEDHQKWFDSLLNEEEETLAHKVETFKRFNINAEEAFQKICEHIGIKPQDE